MSIEQKMDALVLGMARLRSAVLAYSGGLDSTLVLKAMGLSGIRALAVTGRSETTPAHDLSNACSTAGALGIPHRVMDTREMEDPSFTANPPDRCYHCKRELFGLLRGIAGAEGYVEVLDGSNLDDLGDYRPGLRAAREHGVRHPLVEARMTKADIREASRALGLAGWDRPSSPCLSSRFPYGVKITPEALRRVAEAEDFLRAEGFTALRVRDHSGVARIEVPPEELQVLLSIKERVAGRFRALGYDFVCLDLEGLGSGSLNRTLGRSPGA